MSPLARIGTAIIGVGLAVAVVAAARGAFSFSVVDLADKLEKTRHYGELRDEPGALPFVPARTRDLSRPSHVAATRCADAEVRALSRAGWTMTGHSWATGRKWRVEAFQLQPPDADSSSLDLVREADARCPAQLQKLTLVASSGVDSAGWAVLDRRGRPVVARAYARLSSGRVHLVTVLAAPHGEDVVPALTTTFREAFTPVPR